MPCSPLGAFSTALLQQAAAHLTFIESLCCNSPTNSWRAVLPLQALLPGQLEVQQELQDACQLAQQAVARQVGLTGLAISSQPGETAARTSGQTMSLYLYMLHRRHKLSRCV